MHPEKTLLIMAVLRSVPSGLGMRYRAEHDMETRKNGITACIGTLQVHAPGRSARAGPYESETRC